MQTQSKQDSEHTVGKPTPGPWKLQDDETPWTCGDARTAIEEGEELGHTEILSSLLAGDEGDDWPIAYLVWEPLASKERCDELRANARLIAAAPELLEALLSLQKEIRNAVKFDVKKHYSLMLADAVASKVIAKATGEVTQHSTVAQEHGAGSPISEDLR